MAENIDFAELHLYFQVALKQCFLTGQSEFISTDEAIGRFLDRYFGPPKEGLRGRRHSDVYTACFVQALLDAEREGGCEIIRDPHAVPFVQFNRRRLSLIFNEPGRSLEIQQNHRKLGSAGDRWLGSALYALASKVKLADVEAYYATSADAERQGESLREPGEPISEDWEPLAIERESADYMQVVSSVEAAIHQVEISNGYAATDPEERNAVLAVTTGTLEAVKTGAPTRAMVIEGLLTPLRYLAKKFGDSAIGEAAKIAVGHLVKWLFS